MVSDALLLTINNPTPEINDRFGWSVAATPNGDLLVGVAFDNAGAADAGAAYLFDGVTGNLLLTINNPTPEVADEFGHSVAATPNGDLLVGARTDNTGATSAGTAYLFDGVTGNLLLTINNPTPEAGDEFSFSVAATPNGDLLVGASSDNTGAGNAGAAYLFDGVTGNLLLTINNPTPEANDWFGFSVAVTLNGDLLVGARRDNTGATRAGAAYLFDGITGNLLLTINNPTPEVDDQFGISVAATPNGDLLIGARLDNTGANNAGAAYLFDGVTGNLLLTINNPTPEAGDELGIAVAATPNGDLLVGARLDNTGANNAGAAYLFDGVTGNLLLTVNNPTPEAGDELGIAVAATPNGDLLVGAWIDNTGAADAGAAYLFRALFCGQSRASYPSVVMGTAGADNLVGTASDDLILSLDGNDTVDGRAGNDCLIGGEGNDRLFGNDGDDGIAGGNGADNLHGGFDNGLDIIDGDAGDDFIRGGPGNDVLSGGEDDDYILGQDGIDICNGDAGNDSIGNGCEAGAP